jgi:hypothetical protein
VMGAKPPAFGTVFDDPDYDSTWREKAAKNWGSGDGPLHPDDLPQGFGFGKGGALSQPRSAGAAAPRPIAPGVNQAAPQASSGVGFGDQRDARDIRAGFPSQSNSMARNVPILRSSADDFAAKAVQAYNSGDKVQGDKYMGYASQYYKAAGDAQQSANNLGGAAYKSQLPPAAVGGPGRELAFEVELGGAAYLGLGGNFELKANVNLSRPLASGLTEFEAGLGVGVGFKAKSGLNPLQGAEPAVAGPFKPVYSVGGQANGTGAIATKLEIEGAVPFLTLTGLEMRGGVQSPLNGVPATDKNFGGFYEVKFLEPKVSPFINIGASVKWDWFNTSYKKSSSGGQ